MALINCPECNKEISSTCEKCIHCGYTLNKSVNSNQYTTHNSAELKNNTRWKTILGVIIGIIAVCYLGFYIWANHTVDGMIWSNQRLIDKNQKEFQYKMDEWRDATDYYTDLEDAYEIYEKYND